ncbi:MAG: hypothetical protein ACFFDC_14335 [Promethearchaeota archaeon]
MSSYHEVRLTRDDAAVLHELEERIDQKLPYGNLHLDVFNNEIEVLPDTIGRLNHLIRLDLSRNN